VRAAAAAEREDRTHVEALAFGVAELAQVAHDVGTVELGPDRRAVATALAVFANGLRKLRRYKRREVFGNLFECRGGLLHFLR
jgi:hypothetical protein